MDEDMKPRLEEEGYKAYKLSQYKRGEDPQLDKAAERVPHEFWLEGSMKEVTAGGKPLVGSIFLEEGWFIMYLPPEDLNWGSKSQAPTPGYRPSPEGAKEEFHRWLGRLT